MLPFQVSQVRKVVVVVAAVVAVVVVVPQYFPFPFLVVNSGNKGKSNLCPDPSRSVLFFFLPGCSRRWETERVGVQMRRGRTQSSVRVSASVSSGGSCCTSATTMPRWSFSKDCFIWSRSVTDDCRICCHLLS